MKDFPEPKWEQPGRGRHSFSEAGLDGASHFSPPQGCLAWADPDLGEPRLDIVNGCVCVCLLAVAGDGTLAISSIAHGAVLLCEVHAPL